MKSNPEKLKTEILKSAFVIRILSFASYLRDWYNEIFGLTFLWYWFDYIPFFFTHAPRRKWHAYFASSWRFATASTYTYKELKKVEDNVFAFGQRRAELEEAGRESYIENRKKAFKDKRAGVL